MMKVQVKFDFDKICKRLLREELQGMSIPYKLNGRSEVQFLEEVPTERLEEIRKRLSKAHINIITDKNTILIQQIKENITYFVENEQDGIPQNLSTFLADRLPYSYAHLARMFSDQTYSSIENYYLLKKIDLVKSLMVKEGLTLTEVSHRMGYSSVAHLSAQFKRTTGINPTSFQRIIKNRD